MSNLTFIERERIQFYLQCKQGIREISRLIHRDHSVISREVRRNGGVSGYDAKLAQAACDKRLGHNRTRKLDKDSRLKNYVVECLKKDWSPKVIAGRLKIDKPPELEGKKISHESIYQYIYEGEGRYENLYQRLCRGRKKRQKIRSRKPQKNPIKERVSIHFRPEAINRREEAGHWESDSMICKKQKEILSVQHERKIKLTRVRKLKDKTATETKNALTLTVESFPFGSVKSITFDNGGEGALHTEIRDDWSVDTYFCDPYCSWQKGGVEQTNSIIRRYIPKDADLSKLTNYDIQIIQEKINNTPRESLGFRTPNELAKKLGWI